VGRELAGVESTYYSRQSGGVGDAARQFVEARSIIRNGSVTVVKCHPVRIFLKICTEFEIITPGDFYKLWRQEHE
jgi:hypothetical protein